jgi:hypothetical protein
MEFNSMENKNKKDTTLGKKDLPALGFRAIIITVIVFGA